jgi:septal ring factor EnvC (AmiA/AmiB activator)
VRGAMSYLEGKLYGILIVAKKGDSVKAVASGTVISAGPYRGFGQVVFVQAEDGYVFAYGGNDIVRVKGGDSVKKGTELGTVGLDAKNGKPSAYFIVFRNGSPIDPVLAPRS